MRSNSKNAEYESKHHELVATKPDRVLLAIRPSGFEDAKDFLGAANDVDASVAVKEHFAEMAGQLQ